MNFHNFPVLWAYSSSVEVVRSFDVAVVCNPAAVPCSSAEVIARSSAGVVAHSSAGSAVAVARSYSEVVPHSYAGVVAHSAATAAHSFALSVAYPCCFFSHIVLGVLLDKFLH